MSADRPSFPGFQRRAGRANPAIASLIQTSNTAALATGVDTALPTVSALALDGFTLFGGVFPYCLVPGLYVAEWSMIYIPGAITDTGSVGFKLNGAATVWPTQQIIWSGQVGTHQLSGKVRVQLPYLGSFELRVRSAGSGTGTFRADGTFSLKQESSYQ